MTLEDGDTVLFHLSAGIYEGPQNARGDFLATVWLHEGKLNAEYRFRWWATSHKLDMDGGLDDDKKSFYQIGPVDDSPEHREKLISGLRLVAAHTPGFHDVHEEIGNWDVKQFIYEVMDRGPMRTQITKGPTP